MKKESFFLNGGIDGMKLNGIVNAAAFIEEIKISSNYGIMGYGVCLQQFTPIQLQFPSIHSL